MARRRGFVATVARMHREAERQRAAQVRAAAQATREAQRAQNAALRARAAQDKAFAVQYAAIRTREAAAQTAEVEATVDELSRVLAATLDVDDYLDLDTLRTPPALPPFEPSGLPYLPPPPAFEQFLPPAPRGAARLFGSGDRQQRQTQQAQLELERAQASWEQQRQAHATEYERQRAAHEQQTARLAREHEEHDANIVQLKNDLAQVKPEAVIAYLDLVLERASYPDTFPHAWSLSFAPDRGLLTIDYELPPADVVPKMKGYKYVKASDTITETARPNSQIKAIYTSVVHQTALRVVHEVLEADRAHLVKDVILNAFVSGTDPATGRTARRCLVALTTSRQAFDAIDLRGVDPTACLKHLSAALSRDPLGMVEVPPAQAPAMDLRMVIDGGSLELTTLLTPTEIAMLAQGSNDTTAAPPIGTPLVAGQVVELSGELIDVGLTSGSSDLTALILNDQRLVNSDSDFIYFNQPVSTCGSIALRGGDNPDGVTIDLRNLPSACERVAVVASPSAGTGSAGRLTLLVLDMGGAADGWSAEIDGTQLAAVVCIEIYRRGATWRLRNVGQGYADGLAGLARDFGVSID